MSVSPEVAAVRQRWRCGGAGIARCLDSDRLESAVVVLRLHVDPHDADDAADDQRTEQNRQEAACHPDCSPSMTLL